MGDSRRTKLARRGRNGAGAAKMLRCAATIVAASLLAFTATAGAAAGRVVVADMTAFGGANMLGGVMSVNPFSGARAWLSSNDRPAAAPYLEHPAAIAVSTDGRIFVVNRGIGCCGSVLRVDPASGARTDVGQAGEDPWGVAIEAAGTLVVGDAGEFAPGSVLRIDPASGVTTTLSRNSAPAGGPAFSFGGPVGVAVETSGAIVAADPAWSDGGGALIRVHPSTGARTLLSANGAPAGGPDFAAPRWVAVEADGDLLVTDAQALGGSGAVIRVDPVSGARTTLSSDAAAADGHSLAPGGIAVDAAGSILVTGRYDGVPAVVRIDPVTGARAPLSRNGAPAGAPELRSPEGIAVEPSTPNAAPDCSAVTATPAVLEHAPGKFVRVTLQGATDADGDPLAFHIDGVTQDETVGSPKGPDARYTAAGANSDAVLLRAQSSARGDGRVYRIVFSVSDPHGAGCTGVASVSVPRGPSPATWSGPPAHNSFGQ